MIAGIIAGITWALETVILGIALGMTPFLSTQQAVFLAPFVSTFLHDACSAVWACCYNGMKGNLGGVWKAFKTKSGKWVAAAAVIGGPIGMTGYVMAVNYMGASIGAVASAIFPAVGLYFPERKDEVVSVDLPDLYASGRVWPELFSQSGHPEFLAGPAGRAHVRFRLGH